MATYTISMLDILQCNADGRTLDPMQPGFVNNVTEIARENIFAPDAIEKIDEPYRDMFAAGFTMNYLYDEIGVESLAGWRFMLAGRVMGLSGYINEMMGQLDQQIFSRYATRRVDRTGTENRSDEETRESTGNTETLSNTATVDEGTVSDEGTREGTSHTDATTTGESESEDIESGDTTVSVTGQDEATEHDKTSTTVVESGTKSGHTQESGDPDVTVESVGVERTTNTESYNGYVERDEPSTNITGEDGQSRPGNRTHTVTQQADTKETTEYIDRNSRVIGETLQTQSNTPQGQVGSVIPSGGLGVVNEQGEMVMPPSGGNDYISSAAYNKNGNVTEENGTEVRGNQTLSPEISTVDIHDGRERTRSGSIINESETTRPVTNTTTSHNKRTEYEDNADDYTTTTNVDTGVSGRQTITDHGRTDTTQHGRTTTTTGSSSDSTDSTVTDSGKDSNTSTRNLSGSSDTTGSSMVTDSGTVGRQGDTTTDGTEDVVDKEMTQEALMNAQPIMRQVWRHFDDLFLQLV